MSSQTYFLTYGRGAFNFMLNELKSVFKQDLKLTVLEEITEGKYSFQLTNPEYHSLINLKTIERIFLSILFHKFNDQEVNSEQTIFDLIKHSIKCSNLINNEIFQLITNSTNKLSTQKRISLPIKFRVNCKLRGKFKKENILLKKIVKLICDELKLINLKFELDEQSAQFEIICHLNDKSLIMGIPLTPQPLSKRDYIHHLGLRSTTCAMMLQLADIKPNEFVLDPFCGASTILSEYLGSKQSSNLFYISLDSDTNQLELSKMNLKDYNLNNNLINSMLKTSLPFKKHSFDLIISDLPFGLKHHLMQTDLNEFYKLIFYEFNRLLSFNGRCVLLINKNHVGIFEKELLNITSFNMVSNSALSLGETNAQLIKLNKI